MRKFPKHINNRQDLEHLMALYPDKTKEYLSTIVGNRSIWIYVEEITGEGITDDTHKVMTDEESGTKYQYELIDNLPPIEKLGFTSYDEVINYIGE